MNNLIIQMVQAIEDMHPGLGVHAYTAAARAGGIGHLGNRMLSHAKTKGKVVKLCSKGEKHVPMLHAIVDAFIDTLTNLNRSRIKQIAEELQQQGLIALSISLRGSKVQLMEFVSPVLKEMDPEDLVNFNIIKPMEYEKIDKKLQRLRINKVAAQSPMEINNFASATGVKLQGNDAKVLMLKGGGEIMIRHLNLTLLQAHMEANVELNAMLDKLAEKCSEEDLLHSAHQKW